MLAELWVGKLAVSLVVWMVEKTALE